MPKFALATVVLEASLLASIAAACIFALMRVGRHIDQIIEERRKLWRAEHLLRYPEVADFFVAKPDESRF
jgi:hypothetical protein